MFSSVLGAVIDLNGRPHYLHSGWFLISVANLVVIVLMVAVFVLAISLPFPGSEAAVSTEPSADLDRRVRESAVAALPPEQLLPDTQPAYVASWIYVFGVLTLAAFVVILASGAVIAIAGPVVVAHLVGRATSSTACTSGAPSSSSSSWSSTCGASSSWPPGGAGEP